MLTNQFNNILMLYIIKVINNMYKCEVLWLKLEMEINVIYLHYIDLI